MFTEDHTTVSFHTGLSVQSVLLKVNVFLSEQTELSLDWFCFCTYWAEVAIDVKSFRLAGK